MNKYYMYLYGIVQKTNDSWKNLKGIENEVLDAIHYEACDVVYGKINYDRCGFDVEKLQKHNEVLMTLMDSYSVLPFTFGTIMVSKKNVDQLMKSQEEKFLMLLNEYKGKVEVGLKVFSRNKELPSKNAVTLEKCEEHGTSGKAYIMNRYKVYSADKQRIENIKRELQLLLGDLEKIAYKWDVKYLEKGILVVNASYLISRDGIDDCRKIVSNFNQSNRNWICKVSGPWPPYSFVENEKGDDLLGHGRG